MTKTTINRINEITAQITACSKDAYHREELLPELLELQKQLINLVFNDTHAEIGRLRIWDVERHLDQMNVDCGHVADELLAQVLANCKNICNMIKSEFSRNAGERKAFWSIDTIRCKKTVLKNVEFRNGEHRTELDGIVFTEKAIFVIEVKNPSRDIYIDERGNYCRIGTTMTFDKNIGEKMNEKVSLLKDALAGSGIENFNIENIVVFTNNNIRVDNRYPHINTCFLSDMPHMFNAILDGRPTDLPEIPVDRYFGFLFRDRNGMPEVAMHWKHRFNHAVKRYNEIYKLQMPNITPHVCRHTYCSNQARSGMNPKTLQYLMSHSGIGVTMNTYTHLGLDDAKDEMVRLEELEQARKEIEKASGQKPMRQNMFRAV